MEDIMTKLSQFKMPIRNRKDLDDILKEEYMNQKLKNNIEKFLNCPKVIDNLSTDLEKIQKNFGKLNDILIELSGSSLVLPKGNTEEDLDILLNRGQLWVAQAVKNMIGEPSRCHNNSAELYSINKKKNQNIYLVTGYALYENGGWNQHSWLLLKKAKSTTIIETTKAKRLAYYGTILTDEEAEDFVYYNM